MLHLHSAEGAAAKISCLGRARNASSVDLWGRYTLMV